jgi:hypothetical protein
MQEVGSMFENLQSQLERLRILVASADPKTGKPQSTGSPTWGRSKSVVVAAEGATEPSAHLRQAEILFDSWKELMADDQKELSEAIRAISHSVETVLAPPFVSVVTFDFGFTVQMSTAISYDRKR